ncbi:MAG: hypothetical protein IMF07_03720 [Proteobacteria bacterium]|nr:hypothetical protein [Pseudomonadota bacterium]
MKRNIKYKSLALFICFNIFLITGCSYRSKAIREAVMSKDMSITFLSDFGLIEIIAGDKNKRTYIWDSKKVKVRLIPRKEIWYGKFGLYHPAVRPPHKGVVHMVVEEAQLHYNSINDAIKKLGINDYIYSKDGLLLFFKRTTSGDGKSFVDISVYQIYINGKKPSNLPGSQDSKIKIHINK